MLRWRHSSHRAADLRSGQPARPEPATGAPQRAPVALSGQLEAQTEEIEHVREGLLGVERGIEQLDRASVDHRSEHGLPEVEGEPGTRAALRAAREMIEGPLLGGVTL